MEVRVASAHTRPRSLGTGHSGSSLRGTAEGLVRMEPCTLQDPHPWQLLLKSVPFEAPQTVQLGVASTPPQATRHWPLRMPPPEATQSEILGVAPYTPKLLILGTGRSGFPPKGNCRGWYWAWPHTSSKPLIFGTGQPPLLP